VFNPDELYGAVVRQIRESHKLSRDEFMRRAGLPGKSAARLANIETKDSWKPGDREKVAALLNALQPNFDPRYHGSAVTTPVTTNGIDGPTVALVFADEEPDDLLADVLPVPEVVPLPPPTTTTTTTLESVNGVQLWDSSQSDIENEFADVLRQEDEEASESKTTSQLASDGLYAISNSELQTWKRCRRKWWLAWYRQLSFKNQTFVGARSVGDRVHRALQQWYVPEGQPRVDPRAALERVVVEDWTQIATLARERNVDEDRLTVLAAEFAQSTNLERAMVEGYVQWLEETGADADLRIVASETALEAPVTVNVGQGVKRDEREFKFIGKLDVRARRTTDDVRLFFDHKTVGDLKGPAVTLPQNEQMLHYMLLEFLNTPEGETRCDGALYNMLRRTKRTARAQPPFYDRVEVRHNPYELDSYRTRALAASADILRTIDLLNDGRLHLEVAYPSPRSDCRWDCDFFAVCNLFDDGSAGVEDMVNVLFHETDPRDRYNDQKGRET
jgi:hypothetical protein